MNTTDTDQLNPAAARLFPADHPLRPYLVPISQLGQHPDNPRNGDVDVIVESILTNGVYRPLIVQAATSYVLAGNHTYAALCALESSHAPVVVHDIDDATARRILLVDNRSADRGEYDEAQLLALLQEAGDLAGTGYETTDLDNLAALLDDTKWDHGGGGAGSPEGDVDDARFWPKIELQVPPELFDRWRGVLDRYDGGNDVTKLRGLLDSL